MYAFLAAKAKHEKAVAALIFKRFARVFENRVRDFQESLENRSILDGFPWILRDPKSWIRSSLTATASPPDPLRLSEDLEGFVRIWKDLEGFGRILRIWKDLEGFGRI